MELEIKKEVYRNKVDKKSFLFIGIALLFFAGMLGIPFGMRGVFVGLLFVTLPVLMGIVLAYKDRINKKSFLSATITIAFLFCLGFYVWLGIFWAIAFILVFTLPVLITTKIGEKLLYSKYPELIFLMPLIAGFLTLVIAYGAMFLLPYLPYWAF